MVRAAADDPRPEPAELGVGRHRIRLALDLPVAVGCLKVSEGPGGFSEIEFRMRARAAVVHLVGPHMLLEILGGIEHGTGFEQRDFDPEVGENFDHGTSTSARTNDHDVVHVWTALNLEHDFRLYHPGAAGMGGLLLQ